MKRGLYRLWLVVRSSVVGVDRMRIHGVGTHIVECIQLRRMIEQHEEKFLNFVFTDREIRFCQSRRQATEWFAAIWAAKEAVLQTFGSGHAKDQPWLEIEIDSSGQGHEVKLLGGCAELIRARGITEFQLALSFCRSYATAYVIAVGEDSTPSKPQSNEGSSPV